MSGDLELSVLVPARENLGFIASFAVTDQLVIGAGATSSGGPLLVASSNARHFAPCKLRGAVGLRDVVAAGHALWVCGDSGLLASSHDGGASWSQMETCTDACLFGLAAGIDGAVWVCGERGHVGRVNGGTLERIAVGTEAQLRAIYVIEESVIVLGDDGNMYRWRAGAGQRMETGSQQPLNALIVTRAGTRIVVGDGGFIARSPDGEWFSRVHTDDTCDLAAIAACSSGEIVCVGERGAVLVSRDDGRSWERLQTLLDTHLRSVVRFGPGMLIGGNGGMIAKLAPPGDDTWHDRADMFGSAGPLDGAFAPGPVSFIETGLATSLATIRKIDLIAARTPAFESVYGMPLPRSAATFFARVGAAAPAGATDGNLFEQLVLRDQANERGTGLVEAFCGVFCIGSLRSGDTVHMELYEWDGRRQVLQFDHEARTFSGVVADSLDSFAYRAALERARELGAVSDDMLAIATRKLIGKVDPTFDPRRRDTEFFFYRSHWIQSLLRHDGVIEIADIPKLFNVDFNQVVPHDQLPARFEACERFIPTALYSTWRAFCFDEPELGRYLEIARHHSARLVRDAARLIDELLAGRNELGTIKDVRAHIEAFRALDLDPRRADARRAEAEARSKLEAARRQEAEAELDRTPATRWAELAWRWIDDGIAHRALLARLDARPEVHVQIHALYELRDLPDDERELALGRLARELAPELEALLVGSLVRDDQLEHHHDHDDDHDHAHVHADADDHDADDDEPPPPADQIIAALAMTSRALRLVPGDDETQYTHAMLQIDAGRAGLRGHIDMLFDAVAGYTESNRRAIANRLAAQPSAAEHPIMHHAAARAYASIGEYELALEQVELAVEHGYPQIGRLRVDAKLGELLEWDEFKALFR
jgi:photosystem II stability/assembly factor-like uncharacterized protein